MIRTAVAALLALAAAGGCTAPTSLPCDDITLPARGGAHMLPGTYIDVPYARRDDGPLHFDLFRHADDAARPTAVVLRGGEGRSTIGERTSFVGQIVETLADAGYQVVLPDYRSTSAADAAEDVGDLFQSLRCHAGRLGVDPDRVVLLGEHTGGDVALRLTADLAARRRGRSARWPAPPRATVSLGGTYRDIPTLADPTLLVHGSADTEVPVETPRGVCATAEAAATCEVDAVDGASHRVENWWPSQWAYKARLVAWLEQHVGTAPAPAFPENARLRKRVTFDEVNGLTLDAYVPEGPGPFAAAILVHGGGWEAGDRVTYITPLFRPLAERNIAWFSIDYRLTPAVDNAAQVDDVARAVSFVREHAAAFRVDPDRLVLVGESASAQLVSLLAVRRTPVAGVVSFYGVYDLLAMSGDPASPRSLARRLFGISTLDEAARATLRAHSPRFLVHSEMPPLLLITGTGDGLYGQARDFEAALREAGASFDAVALPGAPHGMEQWNADERWRTWSTQVVDWIEGVTRR